MPSLRTAADSDKVISSQSVQQWEMEADYPPLHDLGVLLFHQRASQKSRTGGDRTYETPHFCLLEAKVAL